MGWILDGELKSNMYQWLKDEAVRFEHCIISRGLIDGIIRMVCGEV